MYVDVIFELPTQANAVQVPAAALVFRSSGPQVAVVDNAGRVTFRKVTIARDDGNLLELGSGVSPGDKVALNISSQIGEGDKVTVNEATGGRGADVVYDPVGGDLAEPVFRSIAWRGRYLVIGFAQGPIPALPLNLALLKGCSIVGVFWGEFARREPKANASALAELMRWYAEGKLKPQITRKVLFTELAPSQMDKVAASGR
jgi:NADPH2:quinone reductase